MAISQVTLQTKFPEWKDITNAIISAVGDNTTLNTTAKSNLVASINELVGKLGNLTTLNTTAKDDVVGAINEVLGELGDVSAIDSSLGTITNAVAGINALVSKLGDLTTLNTTAKSNLVVALNEVNTDLADGLQALSNDIGDLTALSTTAKTNLVASINEVVGDIGDLSTLSTTAKADLVSAINELETSVAEIGDLTTLNTTDKTDLVSAINEVIAEQLTNDSVDVSNLMTNRGRFSAETTKTLTAFDSTMLQMGVYNAATVAEGDRFLNDNSNYGGAGGTLGGDIGALMTKLQATGRSDNRYGYEFYIANFTAGGGTGDVETYSANNYYPFLTGADAYLGAIGTTLTFQAWVRLKTCADEVTFGGVVLGDAGGDVTTYVDGVKATQQSILAVSDGWTHVRQTVTLTSEFKAFFPAIYANNGDVIQVALPALYNADVEKTHLGVM